MERQLTQTVSIDSNISFINYLKNWANTFKKRNLAKGTWRNYEQTFRIVEQHFGQTKLTAITTSTYQQFLNTLGKHYYHGTIRIIHHRLRSCVKYALADQLISYNFTDLAIITADKKAKPLDEKFLELDEYQRLLQHLKENITNHRYIQLYLIAVTGLRVSESLGLTWADIDLENGIININKTWDIYDQSGFMPTKNPQSMRTIPIDETTSQLLHDYKSNRWQANDLDRVFLEPNQVWLNRVIKKIVGRNVHVHSLRHTYTSYLISQGVELITISKVIGHKDLTVTLQTYAHLLEDKKEKDFHTIRQLFQ
ncbi:site-specific integrase [Streptococcus sp. sy010]|uniref:tyrosine-type recombinase/integrase n=1 Tax=Streptococcus sp. sy010 TaxID=2600148 RepID=UPI0011B3F7B8|nr:site-specific integrase [Streptococcus sp. sy010]TWT16419.1 site-specific integrase [Streptococcus sp. sy010]